MRRWHAARLPDPAEAYGLQPPPPHRRVLARQTRRDGRPEPPPILSPRHPRPPRRPQLTPQGPIRAPLTCHRNILPRCCDDRLNPPSRASAARRAGASAAGPAGAARRGPGASRRPGGGRRRCGRRGRAARPPPRPWCGRKGSRAARRRSRRRWRRRSGTASPRRGCPARPPRTRTGSRDPSCEKSRGLPEDLDLLLEPLDLTLEPLRLGLLGLALGQRLRGPGRQVLVAPAAQLPRADAELGRGLGQALAAIEEPLDRLRLELGGEPPSLPPLRHVVLLG